MRKAKPKKPRRYGSIEDWMVYESRKRAFERKNPDATPEEYDQAMREIAREAGV